MRLVGTMALLLLVSHDAWSAKPLSEVPFPTGTVVTSGGQSLHLQDVAGKNGTVFVFYSTECPLSNGYIPTLNRLAKDFSDKGIGFLGFNPNAGQTIKQIELNRIRYSIVMSMVKDASGLIADSMGVTHCPEVVVFDAQGKAVYRGRIDDRYPRRGAAPKAVFNKHDLQDVLTALADGKEVTPREEEPIGCPVVAHRTTPTATTPGAPTYAREVSRILQKRCQECHREGGIGPFAVDNYEKTLPWADDIVSFTQSGQMPPWKLHTEPGMFRSERRIPEEEKKVLADWVKAGCPEGDNAELPAPVEYQAGWALGEPDIVLTMPEPYTLPAEGPDEYRHFILETNLPEDAYVAAMDVMPGNLRVVHHVIVFLDPNGASVRLDKADPSPGYLTSGGAPGFIALGALGGWAPGIQPTPLPPGTARILPKGTRVVLQIHYHKSGKEEVDQTKIGLYLAPTKPKKLIRDIAVTPLSALPMLQNLPIGAPSIPAGNANHVVQQSMYVPEDIDLVSARPHMHLIGKDMKVVATLPDGTSKVVVDIRNWDFNWQENYYYAQSIRLPKDTRLDLMARFDNSSGNPANPYDPPQNIKWGEETANEMAFCFFECLPTRDAESDEDLKMAVVSNFIKTWLSYQLSGPQSALGKVLSRKSAGGQ